MKRVILFTDGSCLGNPGLGGWACMIRCGSAEDVISGTDANTTNNRMELQAVIAGLSALTEPCSVRVVTDSQYVQQAMTRHLSKWMKRGWYLCRYRHRYHYAAFLNTPIHCHKFLPSLLQRHETFGIVREVCDARRMNIEHFFNDRTEIRTFRALTKAPLAPWIEQYAEYLRQEGYTIQSSCEHLRMLGRFNEWLDTRSHITDIVEPKAFDGFRDHLQQQGRLRKGHETVLRHLLKMMHPDLFVETPSRLDVLLQGFRDYQLNERGLARTSVVDSRRLVQNFLQKQVPGGDSADLSQIQPDLIADWIKRQASRASAAYARHVVTALRSFFSYAFYKGLIDRNLATCVPSVRSWSLVGIPRHLSAEQVQKVLDGCDRKTPAGKRDFAVLLLLARLGLRAGEVTTIKLEDIDWEAGFININGKTRRTSRLPLPQEVGEAIAAYLYSARPRCRTRHVFVRSRAPYRAFTQVGGISAIATRALKNAGIQIGLNGAHVFRHSLATTMLKNGASLGEIGEILRHRRADTTRIYAKVDLASLRRLALPWPGGSR